MADVLQIPDLDQILEGKVGKASEKQQAAAERDAVAQAMRFAR